MQILIALVLHSKDNEQLNSFAYIENNQFTYEVQALFSAPLNLPKSTAFFLTANQPCGAYYRY